MGLNSNKDIYISLENSNTDSTTKYDIKKSLETANDILIKAKKQNPSLFKKFEKEYDHVRQSIIDSIKSQNKVTFEELIKIKSEMGSILYLDNKNDLKKEEIDKLKDTDINEIPDDKLEGILSYLNKNYKKYKTASKLDKLITIRNNTINSLDDKYEVRIFQEKIIKRLLSKNKNLLHGFKKSIGNYVITKDSFENKIGSKDNIQELNSKALYSYLDNLSRNNKLNYEYLSNKFGDSQTDKILAFKIKKDESISNFNLFKGHFKRLSNSIKKYFSKLISGDFQTFDKKIANFNQQKKEKIKKQLIKNPKDRNNLIQRDLEYIAKNDCNLNENHNEVLITSLETSIKESKEDLRNFLKKSGWNDEKINLFFEKIEKKEFNSPKDLALFIKELQKENPNISQEEIQETASMVIEIKSEEQVLAILKYPKKSEEEKQQSIKKTYDKYQVTSTFINSNTFIYNVMNSKNLDNFDQILKESIENDKKLKEKLANIDGEYEANGILSDYLGTSVDINNGYYETKTYQYPNGEELTYVKTPNGYNIDNGIEGNEGVDITEEEFEAIKNKPENLKNLLKFRETLAELNIDFIWEHRFDFIQKLNNIDPTLDIKIDSQNYINNTELKKILNGIIILSGNDKPDNNLNSIKNSLRNISNSWIDSEKKDNKGSPIEKLFIDKGIINKDSTTSYFKIEKMKKNYK